MMSINGLVNAGPGSVVFGGPGGAGMMAGSSAGSHLGNGSSIEKISGLLFHLSAIEVRDEFEEKMIGSYMFVKNILANKSESQANEEFIKLIGSREMNEQITIGMLVSILMEPENTQKYFRDVIHISRDALATFIFFYQLIATEKYFRLKEQARHQMVRILREMVLSKVNTLEIFQNMFRNTVCGDLSASNIYLSESLLDILIEFKQHLEKDLLAIALYNYLRLSMDHHLPQFRDLRAKEINFCTSLLRERFHDFRSIGRDLVRLLQQVSNVPEFVSIWKDLVYNPTKLAHDFTGIAELMKIHTPRRFIKLKLTVEMEKKINFFTTHVRMPHYVRYQEWLQKAYFSTAESNMLRCDWIRYIILCIHPSNSILSTDIIPRWAVIAWLINIPFQAMITQHLKHSLFFDWYFFEERDNIMDIEPAILAMFGCLKSYPTISEQLLEFICRVPNIFHTSTIPLVKKGIKNSFNKLLSFRVVSTLFLLIDNPKIDEKIRQLFRETFPELIFELQHPSQPYLSPGPIGPGQQLVIVQQGLAGTTMSHASVIQKASGSTSSSSSPSSSPSMPSLSTMLSTGSPSTSGSSSSSPAPASSLSLTGITALSTTSRASTALGGSGGNSGSSGHLIVLPPTRYHTTSQLSSSLFHSVPHTATTTAITLSALSSSPADNCDNSLAATKDGSIVDCDELLLSEAATGSTLPKSFTFFNSSSLLSSYSSASSHESEPNMLVDGNTSANFSDDEDDPREPSHSPNKKLKKSNSFNGSIKVEPRNLNAPAMSSNNSVEFISNIIHNTVQSNSASHGNGTPNSATVNDANNGATANHLSVLKNGPVSYSSICGNSALSRDELRLQIEQFSKVEIRVCLQKIFQEKNKTTRCQEISKLAKVVLDDDADEFEEYSTSLTIILLALLEDDLSIRIFPFDFTRSGGQTPDDKELKDSVTGPLFVMFRVLAESIEDDQSSHNTLLTLLAAMGTNNCKVGYLLFYFLIVSNYMSGRMSIYRSYARDMSKELTDSLLTDLRCCAYDDVYMFFYLLPEVFLNFSSTFSATNFTDLLKIIVHAIDPLQHQVLLEKIMSGSVKLLRKDAIMPMLTSSLDWGPHAQNSTWQIVLAHNISADQVIPILAKLEHSEHSEALSQLLLFLQREQPTANLIKHLFNRVSKPGDNFTVSILLQWVQNGHSEKLVELIGKFIIIVSTKISSPNKRNKRTQNNSSKAQVSAPANMEQILYYLDEMRKMSKNNSSFILEDMTIVLCQLRQFCSTSQKAKYQELFINVPDDNDSSKNSNSASSSSTNSKKASSSGTNNKKNQPLSKTRSGNTVNSSNKNNDSETESDISDEEVPLTKSKAPSRKKRKTAFGSDSD